MTLANEIGSGFKIGRCVEYLSPLSTTVSMTIAIATVSLQKDQVTIDLTRNDIHLTAVIRCGFVNLVCFLIVLAQFPLTSLAQL